MPKRYRRFRRRFKKRRGIYRVPRLPTASAYRKYIHGELATKLRIRAYDITSDASGIIDEYYTGRNPSNSNDWNACVSLYDQYRVNGVKIKWFPYQPNSVTVKYMPLYVVYDSDMSNGNPISSLATALDYGNVKVYNIYEPFSYFIKPGRIVATGSTNVILQGGWIDTGAPTNIGCLGVYGEGFTASTIYGHFVITYYLELKNRR